MVAIHWHIKIWAVAYGHSLNKIWYVQAISVPCEVPEMRLPYLEPYSFKSLGMARKEARRMMQILHGAGRYELHTEFGGGTFTQQNNDTADIVEIKIT
jgi:hypothetical protein